MKYETCAKCHMTIEKREDGCMCLKDGNACDDCVHFMRCISLGIAKSGQVSCDFFPIQFNKGGR